MFAKQKHILLAVFSFSALLTACTDSFDVCDSPAEIRCIGNFYQVVAGTESAALVSNLGITAASSNASVFSSINTNSFKLQLSTGVNSSVYFFNFGPSLTKDTVTIKYTNNLASVSPACGNVFNHTITEVLTTTHYLDSIKIINPAVTGTSNVNLKLYF
jgi:hypothetical protein